MRTHCVLLALLMVISATACNTSRPVNIADEENAVRSTDANWLEAVRAKDYERALTFWTHDAMVLPPNSPAIVGKGSIRKYVMGASTLPGFSITWTTGQVWVSGSGDLAYESATNAVTAAAPGGKLVTETNRGIVVWKKQPDGSWKCAVDIWNAEAPATTK